MNTQQVIPYATPVCRPIGQGLRPATILAIFAFIQCLHDTPFFIQQLSVLTRMAAHPSAPGDWMPGTFWWVDRYFNLACSLLLGFAILLMARPNTGRWFFFTVSATRAAGVWLLNMGHTFGGTSWAKFSLGRKSALIAIDVLYILSAIVFLWLLWTIVSNAATGTKARRVEWPQLRRASLFYMLSLGASSLLSTAILWIQAHAENATHTAYPGFDLIDPTAAIILIAAALWALLKIQSMWPCLISLVLWGLHSLAAAVVWIVVVCHQPLGAMWKYMDIPYVHHIAYDIPQTFLLILLLSHPRIRHALNYNPTPVPNG